MNKKLIITLLVLTSVILVTGCVERTADIYKYKGKVIDTPINKETENKETENKETENKETYTGAKHWTYEGEEGPDHWAELGYPDCKGGEQSPVDISSAPIHNAGIIFDYKMSVLNITNNGHTIQVTYGNNSIIDINNKQYKLLQFHFHAPSEHTINGSYYPIELHLVHKSDDGRYAVIGVMLEEGNGHLAYSQIWKYLPKEKGDPQVINTVDIDATNLLPGNKSYYQYNGSFTTPPCTEGVLWFIMSNTAKISKGQIDAFETIYSENNRPIQDLGKREFN